MRFTDVNSGRWIRRTILFLVFCFLSIGTDLRAEFEERDIRQASEEPEEQEKLDKVKRKAEEERALEGIKPISFEEILDDPDNIELNMRYAKQQMADNNLLGAAGTLERILMIDATLAQVRLFYGIVLYRLDNLSEAERELSSMLEYDLPGDIRTNVELYLGRIKSRRKTTRFRIRQTVGYQIDDNKNAAPSSKRTLSAEVPVGLSGTSRKRRDTSVLSITNVHVSHDPGFQAGHEVFADFTYFMQEQTMVDNLDIGSYRGEIGAEFKHPWVNISPSFFMSHLYLSRESFLRTQGFSVRADRPLGKKWNTNASFRYEYQDYLNIAENTTSVERKGPQIVAGAGASYLLRPDMRVSAGLAYTNKSAKRELNAYERLNINLVHLWVLKRGMYLVNSLDAGFDFYDEVDTSVAGRHRRDKTLRYRATLGVPLDIIKIDKILPKILQGITLNLTYEYYRSLSTITNFTYRNNKYQMLANKTWEF